MPTKRLIGSFMAIALFAAPSVLQATSVVSMNFPTLADHAAQVITGEVISVRSYWAADPKRIETEVRFRNVDYLKGRLTSSTSEFSLVVPGGAVGDVRMRICCAPEFKVGQRRLLFLLGEYRTFPTVGIGQGALLIERDAAGKERVYQSNRLPVTGICERGFPQTANQHRPCPRGHLLSSRSATLKPVSSVASQRPAMALNQFIQYLQPVLDASRQHVSTRPAGRRVIVKKTGVPLRSSEGWNGFRSAAKTASSKLRRGAVKQQAKPRPSSSPESAPPTKGRSR